MTTFSRVSGLCVLGIALSSLGWSSITNGQVTAETPLNTKSERQPVDYQPMFLPAWQKQGRKPVFYAWEGEKVVILTSSADLDPQTIDVFLERLDAAAKYCSEITGYSPQPYKQYKGMPTIAAIPDPSLMVNLPVYGGFGAAGGEVSTFDGPNGDYERVRKTPEQFPTSYFQIAAWNHSGHSLACMAFNEGSHRLLMQLCIEHSKLKSDDAKSTHLLKEAADSYAKSTLNIETSFPHLINSQPMQLQDSAGQPLPTTIGVLLGSIVLKLREERGGDEWLKKFYRQLANCPATVGIEQQFVQAQLLNFTIAASLASQSEPSKDFQTRWRFPFDAAVWTAFKKVDWKKPGLSANDVIDALPSKHILPSILQLRPSFLTPERRKQNMLVGGSFEGDAAKIWKLESFRANELSGTIENKVVKEGQKAAVLRTTINDDTRFTQTVIIKPGTRYLLSGWIKTKDVEIDKDDRKYGKAGATLSIWGGYEHSRSLTGTNDWTYSTLFFDARDRTEVTVCARLGYWFSTSRGEAWFDDLSLIPIGESPASPTAPVPVATITTNKDWKGWPKDTPPPAIAPFDAAQAKQHQEGWAKHLGTPVEFTNSIGMKFVLVPPGEFLMGITSEGIEAELKSAGGNPAFQASMRSQSPQHRVILTQPIYLGAHEVTQGNFESVTGNKPSHFAATGAGREAVNGLETTQHPVDSVSWLDVAEFCAKLSEREKLKPFDFQSGKAATQQRDSGYRLPTEAEWERACRAGTVTTFWPGNSDAELLRAAWFGPNSAKRTHAVGELRANPFGLHDVHGNVWEWVLDSLDLTYYQRFENEPALDPTGPKPAGTRRGLRGGSWQYTSRDCWASYRHSEPPSLRHRNVGFRVALSVEAVKASLAKPVQAQMPLKADGPLKSLNDQAVLTLRGSPFTSVAYSPDGKWIATAAINRTVLLWDAEKALPVHTLQGGWCVAFSPDSQRLASAGPENSVRIWNVATGKETQTLKGHTGDVRSVAFSRDGKRLASASADRTVRLWDATTGQPVKTFTGHTDDVRVVAFSPDGMLLASAGKDTTLKVWPLPGIQAGIDPAFSSFDGQPRERTSYGGQAEIRSLVFTADGSQILSAGHDRFVRSWFTQHESNGNPVFERASGTMSLAVSPDGEWIATGGCDRSVSVSQRFAGATPLILNGHASQVTGVAWNPNGKRVASVSYDGTLKLWDIEDELKKVNSPSSVRRPVTRNVSAEEEKQIEAAEKSSRPLTNGNLADGLTGWTLDEGARQFRLFKISSGSQTALTTAGTPTDASTGRLYQCFKVPDDATELRFSLHGGADSQGTYVALWNGLKEFRRAAGRNDNTPFDLAWNIESLRGQVVTLEIVDQSTAPWGFIGVHGFEGLTQQSSAAFPHKLASRITQAAQDDPLTVSLRGHEYAVWSVAVSPDGKSLASGDLYGSTLVWNVANRKLKFELPGTAGQNVVGLAFSPDGKWIATGSGKTAKLWDATNGQELKSLAGHSETITSVAFSPDSKRLATGSFDKSVKVWDVAKGEAVKTLTGKDQAFLAVAFSPDGKWLAGATSQGENYVMLWNTRDWKESQRLAPIYGQVWSIFFSPDSQRLVTASDSGRAVVWDLHSGDELLSLRVRRGQRGQDHMENFRDRQLRSVAFNQDGSHLVTAADSGSIKIWDANTGQKLHELSGHGKDARGAVFSPDGKWVASVGGDLLVKLWTLDGQPKATGDGTIVKGLVDPQKSKLEWEALQGTWRLTNGADFANQLPPEVDLKDTHLVIKDETATLLIRNLVMGCLLTIDPTQTPKAFDMTFAEDISGDSLSMGIYSLNGDILQIAWQPPSSGRPKDFATSRPAKDSPNQPRPGGGLPVMKFERMQEPLARMNSVFDLAGWQRTSRELNRLRVRVQLGRFEPLGIGDSTGPGYVGVVDLPVSETDGTVPADVWKAAASVNFIVCNVTSLTDATLRQLTTHPGLSGLVVNGKSTATKSGLALLKSCPHFQGVTLIEVPQTVELLTELAESSDLKIIEIIGPSPSPELLAAITRFKSVESLQLRVADLTDDTLIELAKLPNLKRLSLPKSGDAKFDKPTVTDKGLQALKSMKKLKRLELFGHGIDNAKLNEINEQLRTRK